MERDHAVVCLSGGLDSCVTAAIAHRKYELALLHVNYGQRTQKRELTAFHDIAQFYTARRKLIADLSYLSIVGDSSLTDASIEVPKAEHDPSRSDVPSTYVPFRNANILCAAVSWAEATGATKVFIGAVEPDSRYPDCRRPFYEVFNRLVAEGTKPKTNIEVLTPLIGMKKWEIIKRGVLLNAPLHLTCSCYDREDIACGECESCAQRISGFKLAGLEDPLNYKIER